jgi:hypothetical protein
MSFQLNESSQINIFGSFGILGPRAQGRLLKTCAPLFADEAFASINESRLSALAAKMPPRTATRPSMRLLDH